MDDVLGLRLVTVSQIRIGGKDYRLTVDSWSTGPSMTGCEKKKTNSHTDLAELTMPINTETKTKHHRSTFRTPILGPRNKSGLNRHDVISSASVFFLLSFESPRLRETSGMIISR